MLCRMVKKLLASVVLALVFGALPATAQEQAPDVSSVPESLGLSGDRALAGPVARKDVLVAAEADKEADLRLVGPAQRRGREAGPAKQPPARATVPSIEGGWYELDVPDVTRSRNSDCETLPGYLDVYTGADDQWYYADVEWSVWTDFGDNGGFGEIYFDDSYEFEALLWCPELDGFGRFTLDMSITFYDFDETVIDVVELTDDFRVNERSLATSKVVFTKKNFRKHGSKFHVRVTRNGAPWRGKRVTWQARVCGEWGEMLTKRANSRGRLTFTADPKPGWNTTRFCGVRGARIKFRFFVAGDATTKGSVSRTFRVKRR